MEYPFIIYCLYKCTRSNLLEQSFSWPTLVNGGDDECPGIGQLRLVTPTYYAESSDTVSSKLNGDVLLFPSLRESRWRSMKKRLVNLHR